MTTKTTALIGLCVVLSVVPAARSARPASTTRNGNIAFLAGGYLKAVSPRGSGYLTLAGGGSQTPGGPCVSGCSISDFEWSPDGSQIAFFRGDAGAGPGCVANCRPPRFALFVSDAKGGGEKRVARCAGDCGGADGLAWSPDSSRIAFAPKGRPALYTVDVESGKLRSLGATGTGPAWSPDGKTIAYVTGASVFTVSATGASRPRVFASILSAGAQEPEWSPDGRTIVFSDDDAIYTARAGDARPTRVLGRTPGSAPYHASWSPDGTRILYAYTPGTQGAFRVEVWTMARLGARKTRLLRTRCCVDSYFAPRWSPNGKQIAFAADTVGGTMVMNADGSDRRTLLSSVSALSWSRRSG